MNHRHIYHRFTGIGQIFIIRAQPTIAPQPRKGPLHNPQPWADNETFWLRLGAGMNFQLPTTFIQNPIDEFATIGAIAPDEAQALDGALDWLEKAYKEKSTWLVWLKVDPSFDEIRSEERFNHIKNQIGFTT